MIKWFSLGFWELIARIVLRNRILMLSIIVVDNWAFSTAMEKYPLTLTGFNLLP
jgi:hypothetical protein